MVKWILLCMLSCSLSAQTRDDLKSVFSCTQWPNVYNLTQDPNGIFYTFTYYHTFFPQPYVELESTVIFRKKAGKCYIKVQEPKRARLFEFKLSDGPRKMEYMTLDDKEFPQPGQFCEIKNDYLKMFADCELTQRKLPSPAKKE